MAQRSSGFAAKQRLPAFTQLRWFKGNWLSSLTVTPTGIVPQENAHVDTNKRQNVGGCYEEVRR